MTDFKRKPNENDFEYKERLIVAKFEGDLDLDWQDIIDILNLDCSSDHFRKVAKGIYESYLNRVNKNSSHNNSTGGIDEKIRDLQKERYKIQTEKSEYNRWLRENSRDELLLEKFQEAIKAVKPIAPPPLIPCIHSGREYALCLGDEHDGVEFQIKGLMGEILNEYNPEIFEIRMWRLLDYVVDYVKKENINTLHVFDFGDCTEGILRIGQLMRLRWGVVDSTVHYEAFLTQWLNELTKHVRVVFQMVFGNHSELRFFNQPSGSFADENMGKLVISYIKQGLSENPNFTYAENPTGLIFSKIADYNFLGIHGNVKDLKKALEDFSLFYKVKIDYIAGGHLHHSACEEIGMESETIRVPSIMGVDPFATSLIKSANAGAKILTFESGYGITDEHRIKLN